MRGHTRPGRHLQKKKKRGLRMCMHVPASCVLTLHLCPDSHHSCAVSSRASTCPASRGALVEPWRRDYAADALQGAWRTVSPQSAAVCGAAAARRARRRPQRQSPAAEAGAAHPLQHCAGELRAALDSHQVPLKSTWRTSPLSALLGAPCSVPMHCSHISLLRRRVRVSRPCA